MLTEIGRRQRDEELPHADGTFAAGPTDTQVMARLRRSRGESQRARRAREFAETGQPWPRRKAAQKGR